MLLSRPFGQDSSKLLKERQKWADKEKNKERHANRNREEKEICVEIHRKAEGRSKNCSTGGINLSNK